MNMEENIDWLFDDPLPSVDMASCESPQKTEVKCEAGWEEQVHDGTGVKAESTVKEEVQVKVEREDQASVVQCLCVSSPGGCGACVLKSGRTEGEQCLEGGSVCGQEQAVDRAAGWGRWPMIKVEGGGENGSVYGTEEEGRRDAGREGMVQPLVSMEDCKVEVKSEVFEGTGVQGLGEGEKVQVEGGVPVQARPEFSVDPGMIWFVCGVIQWSGGSSAPVASGSSLEVREAMPCVSSEETAQLSHMRRRPCSPPRQQQCRKEDTVQNVGGAVHTEGREVSSSHSEAVRNPGVLKKHVCPHCDYRSAVKDVLRRHVEMVHEGVKKHLCPHCGHRTYRKSHLQMHIEAVHEDVKKHACPQCQFRASLKSTLQIHINTVHEGLKKHACPHCPYRAGYKGYLKIHIDTVHEGIKKHACPHCEYRAGDKKSLQAHIKVVHEGSREHACPHCPFRFGHKGNLKKHIDLVHEGIKKHACPHCEYTAGHRNSLQIHTKVVHEGLKEHACTRCQYRTGHKNALKKHIDTIHEGIKEHTCPHCEYRAGHKNNLTKHIKIVHDGVKNHTCPHCEYRTGHKNNLKEHINRVHDGVKKHTCPHCEYGASHKSTLKRHIDSIHEGSEKHA